MRGLCRGEAGPTWAQGQWPHCRVALSGSQPRGRHGLPSCPGQVPTRRRLQGRRLSRAGTAGAGTQVESPDNEVCEQRRSPAAPRVRGLRGQRARPRWTGPEGEPATLSGKQTHRLSSRTARHPSTLTGGTRGISDCFCKVSSFSRPRGTPCLSAIKPTSPLLEARRAQRSTSLRTRLIKVILVEQSVQNKTLSLSRPQEGPRPQRQPLLGPPDGAPREA